MSSPFLNEPVALWEYLSLHTNTTTNDHHTSNSSQTVTAINETAFMGTTNIALA